LKSVSRSLVSGSIAAFARGCEELARLGYRLISLLFLLLVCLCVHHGQDLLAHLVAVLRFLTRFFEEGLARGRSLVLKVLHHAAVLLGLRDSAAYHLILLHLLLLRDVANVVRNVLGELVVWILVDVAQLTAGLY